MSKKIEKWDLQDAKEYAQLLFDAQSLPKHIRLVKKGVPRSEKAQIACAIIAMRKGYELDLPLQFSIERILNVNGRTGLDGQTMKAIIERDCPNAQFKMIERSNTKCEIWTKRDPNQEDWDKFSFTSKNAEQAGLWNNSDTWIHYPSDQLQWKCFVRMARWVYPDVIMGCYLEDELKEIEKREIITLDEPEETPVIESNKIMGQIEAPKLSTLFPPKKEPVAVGIIPLDTEKKDEPEFEYVDDYPTDLQEVVPKVPKVSPEIKNMIDPPEDDPLDFLNDIEFESPVVNTPAVQKEKSIDNMPSDPQGSLDDLIKKTEPGYKFDEPKKEEPKEDLAAKYFYSTTFKSHEKHDVALASFQNITKKMYAKDFDNILKIYKGFKKNQKAKHDTLCQLWHEAIGTHFETIATKIPDDDMRIPILQNQDELFKAFTKNVAKIMSNVVKLAKSILDPGKEAKGEYTLMHFHQAIENTTQWSEGNSKWATEYLKKMGIIIIKKNKVTLNE